MTDLVVTAANCVAGTNARISNGIAGVAITAGQAVYLDSTTGKWALADSDSASAAARLPGGIALNSSAINQPIAVQSSGSITLGATLTPGVTYYLSNTPGGICPVADVGTGEYSVIIGMATSASVLAIAIQASGVAF